jgi:thymidine phosphorylase
MAGYLPQEIIRAKRDGNELAAEEIAFFVRGLTDGSIGGG